MKMWCIYTMEFYSIQKKNEIMTSAGKWIGLEIIKPGPPYPERQILHVLSGIQILAFNSYRCEFECWDML